MAVFSPLLSQNLKKNHQFSIKVGGGHESIPRGRLKKQHGSSKG